MKKGNHIVQCPVKKVFCLGQIGLSNMALPLDIVTCQAHPVLVKKGESNVRFVPFKTFYLGGYLVCLGLVHLWTDQRIPGPVSCRCPGGSLETLPRWYATIYLIH